LKAKAAYKRDDTAHGLLKWVLAILVVLSLNSFVFSFIYVAFLAPVSEYVKMLASSVIISVFGVVTLIFVIFLRSVTDIITIHITSEFQEILPSNIKKFNYAVQLALLFLVATALAYVVVVEGNGAQLLQQWPTIVFIVIAFGFLGITLRLMYNLDPKNPTESYPELKDLVSHGELVVPKRCHMGDTHNISLSLHPAVKKALSYFEVELQGAGLIVNGDLKQQQLIDSDMSYLWNCNFSISGTQVINLIMRLAGSSECKSDLLIKNHEVKVLSRYRQWIPPILVAIVTISSAIIGSLHSIGFLTK
jgi:hypothetical protein